MRLGRRASAILRSSLIWLSIAAAPDGVASFGGVNLWTSSGPATPSGHIYALIHAGTGSQRLLAGTDAGLFASTDAGSSWTPGGAGIAAGPIYCLASASPSSSTLFAGTGAGIYRSMDASLTWTRANQGMEGLAVAALAVSESSPIQIYSVASGGGGSLFKSTDNGTSWSPLPYNTGDSSLGISALAVSPTSAATLFVGTGSCSFATLPCYGTLQKSSDGGESWTIVAGVSGYINQIVFQQAPTPTLCVTSGSYNYFSGGEIQKSSDGGSTWLRLPLSPAPEQGYLANSLAIDPTNPQSLLIGMYDAIYPQPVVIRSADGGLTSAPLDTGLPLDSVTALVVDPGGSTLHAGTSQHGVYDYEISLPLSCSADSHTLCLANGRFQVSAQWTDFNGNTGVGTVVPGATSNNSGVMWFFGPDNWELLIKVLDGCTLNGHYWVFGAAATNVAYTVQVTDTQTGEVKTYTNPLGTVSPAITDTSAFGSCP